MNTAHMKKLPLGLLVCGSDGVSPSIYGAYEEAVAPLQRRIRLGRGTAPSRVRLITPADTEKACLTEGESVIGAIYCSSQYFFIVASISQQMAENFRLAAKGRAEVALDAELYGLFARLAEMDRTHPKYAEVSKAYDAATSRFYAVCRG